MTPEQRAAYVMAQAAGALVEAIGMHAENMQRQALGQSMAYGDEAIAGLIDKYDISHNAVRGFFQQ